MISSPAASVLDELGRRKWTLAIAESLTGGALSAEIVSVAGASMVFRGAVVAYATPVKTTLLGVDAALLAAEGAVHPDVALQMAEGVCHAVAVDGRAADVGLSTTGIAGPGSPDGQPVGTVHIGVATPTVNATMTVHLEGDRAQIRGAAVDAALSALLEVLGNS